MQDDSGCQENVPVYERFFLQPLIPPFRIAELSFEERYKHKIKRHAKTLIDNMMLDLF